MPKFALTFAAVSLGAFIAGAAMATDKPVDFVTKAGQGDLFEVKLAKVALQKSKNAEVRAFATRMVSDHTQSGKELKAVAAQSHITVPAKLNAKFRNKLADFEKKGASFDKDYISFMADDHKDDIAMFDDFAKNGDEPKLKAFAGRTLPVLVQHRDLVESIKSKM